MCAAPQSEEAFWWAYAVAVAGGVRLVSRAGEAVRELTTQRTLRSLGAHGPWLAAASMEGALELWDLVTPRHVSAAESACLFDDDNDLPMAQQCGVQLLPGLTSKSVERAAAEHPEWHVAPSAGQGVFAIEECLELLLARVRREKGAATPV